MYECACFDDFISSVFCSLFLKIQIIQTWEHLTCPLISKFFGLFFWSLLTLEILFILKPSYFKFPSTLLVPVLLH